MRGTFSGATSTPRSPRATITPSEASRMASRFSMACGFSSFATSGTLRPKGCHGALGTQNIFGGAHEGDGHRVNRVLQTEFEVLLIFFGERRNADVRTRQVDALVLSQG